MKINVQLIIGSRMGKLSEHCQFLSGESHLHKHVVRLLEVTCKNGFKGTIFVTKEPPFILHLATTTIYTWYYIISEDGKSISLLGIDNNSVNFSAVVKESCHPTVTNWPLLKQ